MNVIDAQEPRSGCAGGRSRSFLTSRLSTPIRGSFLYHPRRYQLDAALGWRCKRDYMIKINYTSAYVCGLTDENPYHVLWCCRLYDRVRAVLLSGLEVLSVGSIGSCGLSGELLQIQRICAWMVQTAWRTEVKKSSTTTKIVLWSNKPYQGRIVITNKEQK
ncbi:hypothetical protein EVAR_62675_1 [Eumeta japonica]|uniref:Uncharacterized protein n=1 Tax=Eumeta variegata TaxID=151549 RepID=A0A4C1Z4E0_EUMVA|nr:hypothetical protein EVAR_62675_1 [Eumeta japonica]